MVLHTREAERIHDAKEYELRRTSKSVTLAYNFWSKIKIAKTIRDKFKKMKDILHISSLTFIYFSDQVFIRP